MTLNDIYHAIDPVALSLGPLQIRWYGLAYVAGFICAFLVIAKLSQRWKIRINDDAFFTVVFCVIFGVILGGRLGYVLVYGDGYYLQHPEKILAFNEGGMSFHGGLVGVIIGGVIAAKITKIPFLTLADMAVVGVPIGLFFGRCANFINGELWGAPTDMPWGVVFGGAAGTMPRHPSQLYEALLEGVVLFIILFALSRKTPGASAWNLLWNVFAVLWLVPLHNRVHSPARCPNWLSFGNPLVHYGASAFHSAYGCGRCFSYICVENEETPDGPS